MNLPNNQVLLAIGDATGHGVPSAMVTATAKAVCSVLHAFCQDSPQLASSPKVMLQLLNKAVYESTHGKILMTFFIAVLDLTTGELTYATASHDPIYWYRTPPSANPETAGDRSCLDVLIVEPGPRLGQQAEGLYHQAKVQMKPNDLLLLYTDGLPEGRNLAQEEYGDRKFHRSILKHAHKATEEIRTQLLADFNHFIETEPLHDDITLAICQLRSHPLQKS